MAEEHSVIIRFLANVAGAVTGIKAVGAALNGLRTAVTKVMAAFGAITLVIDIFMQVKSMIVGFIEKMEEAGRAITRSKIATEMKAGSDAIERMTANQAKYNERLKETLSILAKEAEIRSIESEGENFVSSRAKEYRRAVEMSGATSERDKLVLSQRYAEEDEREGIRSRIGANQDKIRDENAKASAYGERADAARQQAAEITATIDRLKDSIQGIADSNLKVEDKQKALADIAAQIAKLSEKRAQAEKDYEESLKAQAHSNAKAKALGDQNGILQKALNGPEDYIAANDEEIGRLKKSVEANDKAANEADARGDTAKADELDRKSDAAEKRIAELESENEKLRGLTSALKVKNDQELKDFDEKEREKNKTKWVENDGSFAEEYERQKNEEAKRDIGRQGSYIDRLVGIGETGGNRLTAMGLGDGATGSMMSGISSNVADLVKLFRENIEVTKGISIGAGGSLYTE